MSIDMNELVPFIKPDLGDGLKQWCLRHNLNYEETRKVLSDYFDGMPDMVHFSSTCLLPSSWSKWLFLAGLA